MLCYSQHFVNNLKMLLPVKMTRNQLVNLSCLCLFIRISDVNMGRLVRGDLSKGFVPPIASAVLDLLEKHGEFAVKAYLLMFNKENKANQFLPEHHLHLKRRFYKREDDFVQIRFSLLIELL